MSGPTQDAFHASHISPTGLSPSMVGLSRPFGYHDLSIMMVLQPRIQVLVWALPTSLAATTGIAFDFFSSAYLDVSVRWVCLLYLCIHHMVLAYNHYGFPHSDISGSKLIYSSPKLFAGCRVLLRLLVPRHPP